MNKQVNDYIIVYFICDLFTCLLLLPSILHRFSNILENANEYCMVTNIFSTKSFIPVHLSQKSPRALSSYVNSPPSERQHH